MPLRKERGKKTSEICIANIGSECKRITVTFHIYPNATQTEGGSYLGIRAW